MDWSSAFVDIAVVALIAFAIYMTGSAYCLWALFLIPSLAKRVL